MKVYWGVIAALMIVPLNLSAGTPDEDVTVRELYLAYRGGAVPPLDLLAPDTLWHCTYYHAEKGNFYRASTYLQFYKQRKDKVIRSVTRVTYPRRVSATTYYAFTSHGLISLSSESNIYSAIRQIGPVQFVIEHFQAQGPLNQGSPEGFPALTAPGTSFGYSGCIKMN